MANIVPDKFKLDPVFLRSPILRDGTFRPVSPYENLINNELLLVLNGKTVGYTLDFSVDSNLAVRTYEFDNSTKKYSATDLENINDIFALAELNEMYFVSAGLNNWAIYFHEANTNQALLLDFYLRRFNSKTLISAYIIGRLQGWAVLDIEANLFCFRNGQNIVERRSELANNMNYIVSMGNRRINEIQNSQEFNKYLKNVDIKPVVAPTPPLE